MTASLPGIIFTIAGGGKLLAGVEVVVRGGQTCVGDIQYSCLHANQYEEAIYSGNLL